MADEPEVLFDPNYLHSVAFEGVWDYFGLDANHSRIWTLKSYKVFCIMAALVVLLEFTTSRAWVIFRKIAIAMLGTPIRLGSREPILDLSRGEAIWLTFTKIQRHRMVEVFRPRSSNNQIRSRTNDPGLSKWFGFIAVFSLATGWILDVAVPYLLTDGTFGSPIIRTKVLANCLSDDELFMDFAITTWVASLPKVDAIFRGCGNSLSETCLSPYHLVPPKIEKQRLDYCPFTKHTCLTNAKPFEITHWNVTPYEIGINSPSSFTYNHRLTCSPAVAEEFQLFYYRDPGSFEDPQYSWIVSRTSENTSILDQVLSPSAILLETMNGPNSYSKNNSGMEISQTGGVREVVILPRPDEAYFWTPEEHRAFISPLIRRNDSKSFLIVHRAGPISFWDPIDDPFFQAHNTKTSGNDVLGDNHTFYYPGYEATVLACSEQYQFCTQGKRSRGFCTAWGDTIERADDLISHLASMNRSNPNHDFKNILLDRITVLDPAARASSVYATMFLRNTVFGNALLLRDPDSNPVQNYAEEQWILEVETWFVKAFIDMTFFLKTGSRGSLGGFAANKSYWGSTFDENAVKKWATCGRVLFRDSDYTNIYWYSFNIVWALMVAICVISYSLPQIELIAQKCLLCFRVVIIPRASSTLRSSLTSSGRKMRNARLWFSSKMRKSNHWFKNIVIPTSSTFRPPAPEAHQSQRREPTGTENGIDLHNLVVESGERLDENNSGGNLAEAVNIDNPI